MTAAIGGKVASKVASGSAAKSAGTKVASQGKLASTRPGPNSAIPSKPNTDSPSKKPSKVKPALKAGYSAGKQGKRKWMPRLNPAKSTVRYRQIIAAEVIIGLILLLTDLSPTEEDKSFSDDIAQASAWLVAFFILSVLTSGGPSMARVSASLGGVMLIVLMTKQKNPVVDRFITVKYDTTDSSGVTTIHEPGVR